MVPGVAYLFNVTYTDSIENATTGDNFTSPTSSGSSSPSRDIGVGVGVGVPLGVIALLLSIARAPWERRMLSQMKGSILSKPADVGPYRPVQPPVELSATGHGASELDSQHELKNMHFRAEEPIERVRGIINRRHFAISHSQAARPFYLALTKWSRRTWVVQVL